MSLTVIAPTFPAPGAEVVDSGQAVVVADHGVRIEADAYVRISDFANELFDYVISEWEQMVV